MRTGRYVNALAPVLPTAILRSILTLSLCRMSVVIARAASSESHAVISSLLPCVLKEGKNTEPKPNDGGHHSQSGDDKLSTTQREDTPNR